MNEPLHPHVRQQHEPGEADQGPRVEDIRDRMIPALSMMGFDANLIREAGMCLVFQPSNQRTKEILDKVITERNTLACLIEILLENDGGPGSVRRDVDACQTIRMDLATVVDSIRARVASGSTSGWRR